MNFVPFCWITSSVHLNFGMFSTLLISPEQTMKDNLRPTVPNGALRASWWGISFRVHFPFSQPELTYFRKVHTRTPSMVADAEVPNPFSTEASEFQQTRTGVVARVGRAWVAFHLGSVGIPSNQLQFKIKIELSLEACPRWCASSLPLRRRSVVREGDPLGNRIRRNFDRSRGKSCGNRWVKLIFFLLA